MWEYTPIILTLGLMALCCWNLSRTSFAKVKKVKAQLVEKYTYTPVSRGNMTYNSKCYVVVFETGKGKLSFNVSEFSYDGYQVKRKGTLTYKGNRILEFK